MLRDAKTFFDAIRGNPFNGRLKALQVRGVNQILDAWFKRFANGGDPRHLAYILATAFHETGGRMQPVRETFAENDEAARRGVAKRAYGKADAETGQVYYGRGLVQITWRYNYETFGKLVDRDLIHDPDLALDPEIAVAALIDGALAGIYTGKKLADYFNERESDPVQARRIINRLDCASQISVYHFAFLEALRLGGMAVEPAKKP